MVANDREFQVTVVYKLDFMAVGMSVKMLDLRLAI